MTTPTTPLTLDYATAEAIRRVVDDTVDRLDAAADVARDVYKAMAEGKHSDDPDVQEACRAWHEAGDRHSGAVAVHTAVYELLREAAK
jgi:hypothetical protein